MKFYTSDEHYGHKRIIEFCKRPFADIFEMREFLIKAHNERVLRGDLTHHLGDMFWRTMSVDEAVAILNRLNGQHMLVWGNHDELIENSRELQAHFQNIQHIMYLEKSKTAPKIVLCHYSMNVWRGSHNGTLHLYGHSHAALPESNTLSFDVGVDTRTTYSPWREDEIIEKMRMKKAAGARDPMSKKIAEQPWNKAKDAEVAFPEQPKIPQEVWDANTQLDKYINGGCI